MPSRRVEVRDLLRQLALFRELDDALLDPVAEMARELRVDRGTVLFNVGDEPKGFYFVVFGQIKLSFTSARGDEKVVEVISAGQSFGEAVVFVPRPYPVAAQALADSLLLFVAGETVLDALGRDRQFASQVIAGLCRRIHGLMSDLEANTMRNGVQRVIGYLLRDALDGDDLLEVRLPVSKGVVASRLNITQEHFSRVLHELTARGLIAVDGRCIRVPSVERLRSLSD